MFNGKLKKDAVARFESAVSAHNKEINSMVEYSEKLFETRSILKEELESTWETLNKVRNKPQKMELNVGDIKMEFKKFDDFVMEVQKEIDKNFKSTVGGVGAGVAAGAGVAMFGPSAAMAIATTFGTASTGTLISTLSGAAATKAALAWLGGGALVAGGGGMAAGNAFLALAGPVGWAIGGGTLLTAGLFKSGKNKKIAEDAMKKTAEVKASTKVVSGSIQEIKEMNKLVTLHCESLAEMTSAIKSELEVYNFDFMKMESNQDLVYSLGSLVNNACTAGELLNKPVGAEPL